MILTSENDKESVPLDTIDPAETHMNTIDRISSKTHLDQAQKYQLTKLFMEFADVLIDRIGKMEDVVHKVPIKENKPIKQYPYRIPEAKREEMKKRNRPNA